jgi:hypothetical protein
VNAIATLPQTQHASGKVRYAHELPPKQAKACVMQTARKTASAHPFMQ